MNAAEFFNHARAALQAGHPAEAEAACHSALALEPGLAEAWQLLGFLQHHRGDGAAGLASLQTALRLRPDFAPVHNDLGVVLRGLGRLAEAAASYQRALALAPDFADAHFNLGNTLKELGLLEEAVACFVRADALKPGLPDTPTNCGAALRDLNRLDDAARCYEEALRRQPDFPEARWNRGVLRLLRGDLAGGWDDYEWRWKVPGLLPPRRVFTVPEWDGSDLKGRAILLHAEQGFGDTIQFIRYAPVLAARGATVLLQCQPALTGLMASVSGISEVIPDGATLPAFDYHAPLLSLPRLCSTRLESVPCRVPYLEAEQGRVRLPPARAGRPLRVGFAWAGNPANGADRLRSMPLADWFPFFAEAPATFYSLQCGPRAAELAALPSGSAVVDLSPQLRDFTDTASAVAELDCVITVDTSVAHLAGALGRPVWTLLASAACWRWLLGRADSPWYPTMRLFRQPSRGDWRSVMECVRRELSGLK